MENAVGQEAPLYRLSAQFLRETQTLHPSDDRTDEFANPSHIALRAPHLRIQAGLIRLPVTS